MQVNEEFIRKIIEFASKLISSQEDLPEEFREFLNENRWDLYDEVD